MHESESLGWGFISHGAADLNDLSLMTALQNQYCNNIKARGDKGQSI